MAENLLARLALDGENENESDDDEDEDEEAPPVLLGFACAPKKAWMLRRQYLPCKAGGAAAWLDPDNFPRMPEGCCDFCEEPLQFLLQIYAPDDDRPDAFHRMLFVFMCSKMACLQRHRAEQKKRSHTASKSVKVFRCQLPRANRFYAPVPSKKKEDLPLIKGADLCQWCGTWRGDKCCGGCKKFRYCSRQHQVQHWRAGHSTSCKGDSVPSTNEDVKWLSNGLWPELKLKTYTENEIDEDENALQSIPGGQPVTVDPELQNSEEATAEQKYMARFLARIAKAPAQVLRYCRERGAKVLWMKPDERPAPADILPCQICGGPRMFEFQVLPQLLYYFKVENEPDSLDWSTIAVYSCSDSCAVDGYCSEFVWVQ